MLIPDAVRDSSRLLIDERVGSKELLDHIPNASLSRLDFGDVSFWGMGPGGMPYLIGIERKEIHDFIDSFTSGRLQGHQIPGMANSFNKSYLIVEGIIRRSGNVLQVMQRGKWRDLPLPANTVDKVITTIESVAGITTRFTGTLYETALVIQSLHEWWLVGYDSHKSHLGFSVEPMPVCIFGKPPLIRRIAKELPGIGWERSSEVEKHFGSVEAMLMAGVKEWQSIPKIGKKLAERIVKEIHDDSKL